MASLKILTPHALFNSLNMERELEATRFWLAGKSCLFSPFESSQIIISVAGLPEIVIEFYH